MTMTVNGVDMTRFIARNGLKWQRSDVDGSNAGRLANGDMQRDRVATKIRWDLTCRPLTGGELSQILSAIEDEYVLVVYTDPVTNSDKTDIFYSNNFPVNLLGVTLSGTEYWTGLTFPLIQR